MIGESVYHKIKSTIENKTVRETAKIAEVSPNTVQKYAKMSLEEANTFFPNSKRYSQFDIALKEIEELLSAHPQMKAPKVLRKIQCKYPEISCKERALRNYIKPIREKYKNSKIRYYHPVIENKEKCQVQVDPGEFTVKQDKFGKKFKVYFVVFIFSYSRMMFVSYQERPYKTEDFIKAHLEAFQYFGGIAKEFVYDQTKLVDWRGNVDAIVLLAKALNINASNVIVYDWEDKPLDVTLVIGKDWADLERLILDNL